MRELDTRDANTLMAEVAAEFRRACEAQRDFLDWYRTPHEATFAEWLRRYSEMVNGGRLAELHRDWAVIERSGHKSRHVYHRRVAHGANVTLPWVGLRPLPEGKIRANTSASGDAKVLLRNEVLEVRVIDGQLRLARKERFHDDGDLPVEPYDPYGPGRDDARNRTRSLIATKLVERHRSQKI